MFITCFHLIHGVILSRGWIVELWRYQHTHTHTHTHTRIHTCIHIHAHIKTHKRTCTCSVFPPAKNTQPYHLFMSLTFCLFLKFFFNALFLTYHTLTMLGDFIVRIPYMHSVPWMSYPTSSLFLFFITITVLGVHCDIYRSSYNISQLNSPPPSFPFIPPSSSSLFSNSVWWVS
jgi:hypothetical protein